MLNRYYYFDLRNTRSVCPYNKKLSCFRQIRRYKKKDIRGNLLTTAPDMKQVYNPDFK